MPIGRKEFKGNVVVTTSDKEARVWVCSDQGQCIFRLKAIGKVTVGESDVIVTQR